MCDTFVILPGPTGDGSMLFGKNSNREPNEAQSLEHHSAGIHSSDEKIKCTYIEIPQVKETYAVLLSRPFWMWGAEMGANERGVVIGNEAVWSRLPVQKESGLIGMDLLRLALERSATAGDALATIIQLLADHGQGGICGYEDKRMAYHNSYIITDPHEAWVLETVGHIWAAVRVKDFYAISNGLTIGEVFDESHPELIETARQMGRLKKGATFHFAHCFSDWLYTTFSASKHRRARTLNLIRKHSGKLEVTDAIQILRDHSHKGYLPDTHFLGNRICSHAANPLTRNATQSTGSLVSHLQKEYQTHWVTGTSTPCLGIFKPVWIEGEVLPDIGPLPKGIFDPQTLWWQHERLHRSILLDFASRRRNLRAERDRLENTFLEQSKTVSPNKRGALTQNAFAQAHDATERWTSRVQAMSAKPRGSMIYRGYWQKQNRKAEISVR